MDTVKLEKLQAMKKYHDRIQLSQAIFQYCLTFMAVILCLSKSVWMMSLCFAIKGFFRSTLPCVGAYVMTPKCLFVLCNVIIVILVGESKLVRSPSPPSTSDVYDEYVRRIRSQSLKRKPMVQHNFEQHKLLEYSMDTCRSEANIIVHAQEEKVMDEELVEEEDQQNNLEEKQVEEEEEQNNLEEKQVEEEEVAEMEKWAGEEEEQEKLGGVQETSNAGEDDNYLLVELNRKVEDFIAKVNRQRRIEADTLLCSG